MAKIYAVSTGIYGDYQIIEMFSTKEKAEEYLEWCGDKYAFIDEYDLDNIIQEKYYIITTQLFYNEGKEFITQNTIKHLETYDDIIFENIGKECYQITLTHSVKVNQYKPKISENINLKAIKRYHKIIKNKIKTGDSLKQIENWFNK